MKNLYVGNLPPSTTEAELRDLFEAYGPVERISIITDRDTQQSRGFAFVEMANAAEADAAIEGLNGKDLDGHHILKVNEAKPKTDAPRGGGGQRFGGGNRDDYQSRRSPRGNGDRW